MKKIRVLIAVALPLVLLGAAAVRHPDTAMPVAGNSPTAARAELGRLLFYDNRLSFNNTKSCASCHNPRLAFSDGYRRSITATGDNVRHNAPSLVNAADRQVLDWANPAIHTLERQSSTPLFGKHPVELGMDAARMQLLRQDPVYARLWKHAFPGQASLFTLPQLQAALAAFVRTLRAAASPFDRYLAGDVSALSASARKGWQLFRSERLHCASCHRPPAFTLNLASLHHPTDSFFYNTGLYEHYPAGDQGLYEHTGKVTDKGKFAVPSLRNVALTAPYMHDGSVATLDEALELYSRGGRLMTYGPSPGDGRRSPGKSRLIAGFSLAPEEKQSLIDFLYSLTDTTLTAHQEWLPPAP